MKREILFSILNSLETGIILYSKNFIIEYYNNKMANILQIEDDLEKALLIPELIPEHPSNNKKKFKSEKHNSYMLIGKDGSEYIGKIISIEVDGEDYFYDSIQVNTKVENNTDETEKFYTIFNEAAEGIVIIDSKTGNIVECNSHFQKLTARTESELQKMKIWELRPKERVEIAKRKFTELKSLGKGYVRKDYFEKKNGKTFPVEFNTKEISIDNEKYLVSIIRDLSRIEEAEEKIKENEIKYKELVEQASDGIFISDVKSGKFVSVNYAGCRMFGYTEEEYKKIGVPDLMPAEDLKDKPVRINQLLEGKTILSERRFVKKNGELFYGEVSAKMLDNGMLQGIIRDISIRKKIENELVKSENVFRRLTEMAPVGIYLTDGEGKCTYVNKAWSEMAGLSMSEASGYGWVNGIHPEDRDMVAKHWQKSVETKTTFNLDMRFINKSGDISWVHGIADRITEDNGNLIGYIGININLSERKAMENALFKSEKRFRELFENISNGVLVCEFNKETLTYVVKDFNKAITNILGIVNKTYLEQNLCNLLPSSFVKEFQNNLRILEEKNIPQAFELVEKNEGVITFWYDVYLYKLQSTEIIVVIDDNSEKMRVQEAIVEKERYLTTLMNNLPGMAYTCLNDKNWTMKFISNGCEGLTGYLAEEIMYNKNVSYEELIHPDDKNYVRNNVEEFIGSSDDSYEMTYRIIDSKKNVKWVWEKGADTGIKENGVSVLEGIIQDINDLKTTQYELIKSEDRYRMIFETSSVSLWEEDLSEVMEEVDKLKKLGITNFRDYFEKNKQELIRLSQKIKVVNVNNTTVELYEANSKEELLGSLDKVLTEESLCTFQEEIIALINNEKTFNAESKNKTLKGNDLDVYISVSIPNNTSKFNNLIVCIIDISDRKEAQEKITKTQNELRKFIEYSETIREKERTEISREIHDDLGQNLTAIKLDLAWIKRTNDLDEEKLEIKIDALDDLVNQTIKSVQKISTDLRPGLLDDLGLLPALEWASEEFAKRTNVEIDYKFDVDEGLLSERISTCIFRIFQEGLTNISRHAKASVVNIHIETNNNEIIMIVSDNGIGIDQKHLEDSKSLGLIGMRERALILNGNVRLSNNIDGGTELKLILPLT